MKVGLAAILLLLTSCSLTGDKGLGEYADGVWDRAIKPHVVEINAQTGEMKEEIAALSVAIEALHVLKNPADVTAWGGLGESMLYILTGMGFGAGAGAAGANHLRRKRNGA